MRPKSYNSVIHLLLVALLLFLLVVSPATHHFFTTASQSDHHATTVGITVTPEPSHVVESQPPARNHTYLPPYRDPFRDFIMFLFTGRRQRTATGDFTSVRRWEIVDSIGHSAKETIISPLVSVMDRQYFAADEQMNVVMRSAPQTLSLTSFFPQSIAAGNLPYVQGSFPFALIGLVGVLACLIGINLICVLPHIAQHSSKAIFQREESRYRDTRDDLSPDAIPLYSVNCGDDDRHSTSSAEAASIDSNNHDDDDDDTGHRYRRGQSEGRQRERERQEAAVREMIWTKKKHRKVACMTILWLMLSSALLLIWWLMGMQINISSSEAIDHGFEIGRDVIPVVDDALDLANDTLALGMSMTIEAKSLLSHVDKNLPQQSILEELQLCLSGMINSKPNISLVIDFSHDFYDRLADVPTRKEMDQYLDDLQKRLSELEDVHIARAHQQSQYMEEATTKDEKLQSSVDQVEKDRKNTNLSILESNVRQKMIDIISGDSAHWLSSSSPLSRTLEPYMSMLMKLAEDVDSEHTFHEMEAMVLELQQSITNLNHYLPALVESLTQWDRNMNPLAMSSAQMRYDVQQIEDVLSLNGLLELERRINTLHDASVNSARVKYSELQNMAARLSSVLVNLPSLHILRGQIVQTSTFFRQFSCLWVLDTSIRTINSSLVVVPETYFDLYLRIVNISTETDPIIADIQSALDLAIQTNATRTPGIVFSLDAFVASNATSILPEYLSYGKYIRETLEFLQRQLQEKDPRQFTWGVIRDKLWRFDNAVRAVNFAQQQLLPMLEQLRTAVSQFDLVSLGTFLDVLRQQDGFDPEMDSKCTGTCPTKELLSARDQLLVGLGAFLKGQDSHSFRLSSSLESIRTSLPVLSDTSWYETMPSISIQMRLIKPDFDVVKRAMTTITVVLDEMQKVIHNVGTETIVSLNTTTKIGFDYFDMIPQRSLVDTILNQVNTALSALVMDMMSGYLDMIPIARQQTKMLMDLVESFSSTLTHANKVFEAYVPMRQWLDDSLYATQAAVTSIDTTQLVFGIFLFVALPIPVPLALSLIALMRKTSTPFWILALLYFIVASIFFVLVAAMLPVSVILHENCPIVSDIVSNAVSSLIAREPIETNITLFADSTISVNINAVGIARSTIHADCNSADMENFGGTLVSAETAVIQVADHVQALVDNLRLPFSLKLHPELVGMIRDMLSGVYQIPAIVNKGTDALGCPVLSSKWTNMHKFMCQPVRNIFTSGWFYFLLLGLIFLENGIFFTFMYSYSYSINRNQKKKKKKKKNRKQ